MAENAKYLDSALGLSWFSHKKNGTGRYFCFLEVNYYLLSKVGKSYLKPKITL